MSTSLPGALLRRTLAAVLAAALAAVLTLAAAPSASAQTTVTVNWTQVGIFPRSDASMDAGKVGSALSDGTPVTVACEQQGQPVSNGYQTIDIWDQLSDGTWLPNAFLDTGSVTWTPGVPQCGPQPAAAPSAPPVPPEISCHVGSWWIDSISVHYETAHRFKISLTPTWAVRVDGTGPWRAYVSNEMWHNVQACVPGLYGRLADSIWQQLDCHRVFGLAFFATGETYDLESYHQPLQDPSTLAYSDTHCLNLDDVTSGRNARTNF